MKQKANAFKVNMLKSGGFLGCFEIPIKKKMFLEDWRGWDLLARQPAEGSKQMLRVLWGKSFQNSGSWKAGEIVIGSINWSVLHAQYVFTHTRQ